MYRRYVASLLGVNTETTQNRDPGEKNDVSESMKLQWQRYSKLVQFP